MSFKPVFLIEKTIDEMWFNLLYSLCENGRVYKIDSGSYAGSFRLEFDYVSGTILKPLQYTPEGNRVPLAVSVPVGCPAPTTESKIEEYFATYIMDGRLEANEHYKYATWIRGGQYKVPKGIILEEVSDLDNTKYAFKKYNIVVPDQVGWCIEHYKKVGFGNNHCIIQVGYPESNFAYDIKFKNEIERQTSPCLRMIDTKIIKDNGELFLSVNVYFRSWDLYSGFPENLGGITLLMEYIATELGINVGSLSFASKGLHCYDHSIEAMTVRSGNSRLKEAYEELKANMERLYEE
jgi:thymidylate synthase